MTTVTCGGSVDELKFKNCMRFKRKTKIFFCWYYSQRKKFYYSCGMFDANNIFSCQFIQNMKHTPNVVKDLSKPTKKAP